VWVDESPLKLGVENAPHPPAGTFSPF